MTPSKQSIWFDDGDLIIKVVKDEIVHLHCIYACTLRLHSEVFRDMLEVSRNLEQEKILDRPSVQLHDDPKDVYQLLKVIYYPGSHPFKKLRQATFDRLEPVLRLADKYQMQGLSHRLRPILEQDWPSELRAWDANEAEITLALTIMRGTELSFGEYNRADYLDEILPEPCRVIRLARQCGFTSILPSAFYHLFRTTNDRGDKEYEDSLSKGARTAAGIYLAGEDWITLHTGRLNIRKWCAKLITELRSRCETGSIHSMQGSFDHGCLPSMSTYVHAMHNKLCSPTGIDPLNAVQTYGEQEGFHDICRDCRQRVERVFEGKRDQLWDLLPAMFNLPGWPEEELMDSDEEEM